MNRRQLEHLIRAASTIAEDDELIIVGTCQGAIATMLQRGSMIP